MFLGEKKKRAREWKTFRRRHNFTQRSLAQILGITRECVQKIEYGSVIPRASTLSKFETLKARYANEREFWKEIHSGGESSTVAP